MLEVRFIDMDSRGPQIIDFLYGKLSPDELAEFQAQCREDASLREEVVAFRSIGKVYRHYLPEVKPPAALVRQVLQKAQELPQPRKRRVRFFNFEFLWRPALTGAFVLVLTLGGFYQYKRWREHSAQLASSVQVETSSTVENSAMPKFTRGGHLSWSELAAAQPTNFLTLRSNRPAPNLGGSGLVTFASYGSGAPMGEVFHPQEIFSLDQEAQFQIAQFSHQQAMRMHASGDHEGASEAIARLVKNYPNYPRLFEAMALRIGCLFQLNQIEKAEQELSWLRQKSPELAVLVERRWRD